MEQNSDGFYRTLASKSMTKVRSQLHIFCLHARTWARKPKRIQVVFPNLEMKPIMDGSERDNAERGFAEFVIASADAPAAFDAAKEIFDDTAVGISQLGVKPLAIDN